MTVSFLCVEKRERLSACVKTATSSFLQFQEESNAHQAQNAHNEAIKAIGAAYETAEILMNIDEENEFGHILRYTATSSVLSGMLIEQNEKSKALQILLNTHERLASELNQQGLERNKSSYIMTCLNCLESLINKHHKVEDTGEKPVLH